MGGKADSPWPRRIGRRPGGAKHPPGDPRRDGLPAVLAIGWPLLYAMLDSFVPEIPGAMCIYGVTKVMPVANALVQAAEAGADLPAGRLAAAGVDAAAIGSESAGLARNASAGPVGGTAGRRPGHRNLLHCQRGIAQSGFLLLLLRRGWQRQVAARGLLFAVGRGRLGRPGCRRRAVLCRRAAIGWMAAGPIAARGAEIPASGLAGKRAAWGRRRGTGLGRAACILRGAGALAHAIAVSPLPLLPAVQRPAPPMPRSSWPTWRSAALPRAGPPCCKLRCRPSRPRQPRGNGIAACAGSAPPRSPLPY